MADDTEVRSGAFKRLAEAFPSAWPMPAVLVDVTSTCDEAPSRRARALGEQDVSGDDVLDALRLTRWARSDLDRGERRLIAAARARGVTWRDIAVALELDSPQGAQRRKARLDAPASRRG